MTDAVITWVDGQDPEHIEKRSRYLQQEAQNKGELEANASLATRFHQSNEIYYCIHSIRRFAKWVDQIFLITDSQRPHWLDPQTQRELGVTIVDHKVIFRNYEHFLPTFNSLSIETVMHRIPGIARNFVYFNDDVMIIKPTSEATYFASCQPVFRGHVSHRKRPFLMRGRKWKSYARPDVGLVGLRLGNEDILRRSTKKVLLYHAPHPITGDIFSEIMESRIAANAHYRFRNIDQFNSVGLYANICIQKDMCKVVDSDVAYFERTISGKVTINSIHEKTRAENVIHACFQGLDEFDGESRQAILGYLESCIFS